MNDTNNEQPAGEVAWDAAAAVWVIKCPTACGELAYRADLNAAARLANLHTDWHTHNEEAF